MSFCVNCGAEMDPAAAACPSCSAPNPHATKSTGEQAKEVVGDLYKKAFDTADSTHTMNVQDIKENRPVTLLAYLGPLVFIPFFSAKDSKFARFHSVQGMNLFICEVALNIIAMLVAAFLKNFAFGVEFIERFLSSIVFLPVNLACVIFSLIGLVNVVRGHSKELPLIGKVRLVKFDPKNYN